jgi:hypothetical protein
MELEYYGKFVVYNGMKFACKHSKQSGEFLLTALYSVVDKMNATSFLFKGVKDYLEQMTEEQLANSLAIDFNLIKTAKIATEWVLKQEKIQSLQIRQKAQQQKLNFNRIDRYKALELQKSLIFQHLKSLI